MLSVDIYFQTLLREREVHYLLLSSRVVLHNHWCWLLTPRLLTPHVQFPHWLMALPPEPRHRWEVLKPLQKFRWLLSWCQDEHQSLNWKFDHGEARSADI